MVMANSYLIGVPVLTDLKLIGDNNDDEFENCQSASHNN